ncbi:hypothetical protein GOP47_0015979 [Adiantum capillus-veneris]|uniref:Mannan endo-1,4-beta-mannosidase n=1 Tax=Adiantum capillus-veneris TaxID=13818 RepID=A0A9D4ULU4_ADICA|nr:hypothetical protein GOP47_0015979 [Adiantum capillus-veneris]
MHARSGLQDGSQVQLKSVTLNKYMSAEGGGGQQVVVNRQTASGWETFKVWRYSDGIYNFRVFNNQFITAVNGGGGDVKATGGTAKEWERFTITRNSNNNRVHIKANNGMYLQAKANKDSNNLTADYVSPSEPDWGNNSATFEMTITIASPLHGEYQLANGWGPKKAARVFKNHRDSFITAADFEYLSKLGINGVRIPVGYWIASDPNPPKPFVPGSLQALDNAFVWAEDHKMKIIIDLHAVPGSQNGQEHSASIDGVSQWATGSDDNGQSYIDLTLQVIEFLASRYSERQSLFGIELLNEPMVNDVPIDTLKSYYKKGYDVVRKYNANTYVIMCQLVGGDPADILEMGIHTDFSNAILDLHYYNVFGDTFANLTAQQNIDYINNNRHEEIERLNKDKDSHGFLTFVGEWTNEWALQGATQRDYQKFGEAQLQIYGQTTAGWAYWNYIIDEPTFNHWDFKQSYERNYLLRPSTGWIS